MGSATGEGASCPLASSVEGPADGDRSGHRCQLGIAFPDERRLRQAHLGRSHNFVHGWALDLPDQVALLQENQYPLGRVDGPPPPPVEGDLLEQVVHGVVSLPEAQELRAVGVTAAVARVVDPLAIGPDDVDRHPLAPQVTDGVDAPGHVQQQENPQHTGDQQAVETLGKHRLPAARCQADRPADERRQREGADDQPRVVPALELNELVGRETVVATRLRRLVLVEQPAHVRPADALQVAPEGPAVLVRRVGIAGLVRVLVMKTVRSDPAVDVAFQRQAAGQEQDASDNWTALVTLMGEEAVVAESDAEAGEGVQQPSRPQHRRRGHVARDESPDRDDCGGMEHKQEREDSRPEVTPGPLLVELVLGNASRIQGWHSRSPFRSEMDLGIWFTF